MSRDTTVIRLRQPDAIDDPLSELAREGARRMLAQALTAEADAFVAMWQDVKLPDGRDRVVRHGHGPERAIQNWGRACRSSARQGPRPRQGGRGGEDPVHLFDPAELGAADRNVGLGPSHDWGLHTLRTPLA